MMTFDQFNNHLIKICSIKLSDTYPGALTKLSEMEIKKAAAKSNPVNVLIPDSLGFLVGDASEDIQCAYYSFLIKYYHFLNPILYWRKMDLWIYTYHGFFHQTQKYTKEDRQFLAKIHAVLLYKKHLLSVEPLHKIKSVIYNNLPNATNIPLLVYKFDYDNLPVNQQFECFELNKWKEIPTPIFN